MVKQSDLVNSNSPEVCGTDDEFEEYTEEEILSGEEQNEEGSSDEESAEVTCEEEPDEENSCAEELDEEPEEESEEEIEEDEEPEEESEEESEEDVSAEDIIEEEEDIIKESEEVPNGKEPLKGSRDQLPIVNDSGVPSLLEQKKTLDTVVDVPQASSRRRRSGWDIKAEDVKVVNDSGDVGKTRKTRWSSDVKAEASMLVNEDTDINKRRKTRWSSAEALSGIVMLPDSLKCDVDLQKLHEKLQLLNKKLEDNLIDPEAIGKKKKPKLSPKHSFMFSKKIYVPLKEYPGYNFIGLILGPRGNSLRKMEEETGATIRLRGKGSYLKKTCPHNHDDLHVLIEADNQSSVDNAASMMEKLLVPVEDRQNYHKAAQLRELAELRGTLVGGKPLLTGKKIDPCDVCGMSTHSTSRCPLTATVLQTDAKVMAETCDKDNPDPTRVYVGRLPYSLSSEKLKELFLPYGSLCEATVMMHKSTGVSKGYGIVKYTTPNDAANAIEKMNGYRIDGKQLVVRIASTSPPSDEIPQNNSGLTSNHPTQTANLPSSSGLAAIPPSANLPSHSGLPPFLPSSLNANMPSYPGLAVIPPSSLSASLPSYSGLGTIAPSSSNENLPTYPRLVATPSSKSNLPSYPGFSAVPPSALLPSYPGLAAIPPSSLTTNLPTFPALAASETSSMLNLPSFPRHGSMYPCSTNANLPSYPQPIALPLSSVNVNLPSNSGPASLLLDTKLPNFPGRVDIAPSNLIAKLPIYSGPDVIPLSSSNAKLPSYPGFAAIPSSSSANLLSYPGVAATPSSSNSVLPSYPRPATLSPSSMNANFPSYSRSTPHPPSNAKLSNYPGLAAISPSSSIGNPPSDPRFDAVPWKIPEQSAWPGPPGSILPESGISFFKSSYNSLAQTGGVPLQSSTSLGSTFETSTSLGRNMSILAGKKLELTVTEAPTQSLNPNLPNYTGFTATFRGIPEPNCITAVPSELASFPGYLKSIDTYSLDQSMPSGSLSSQQPHFTKNFSVNQINPTLRNYNHPSSN